MKPLLNQDELANSNRVVKKFGAPGGDGQKLQKMLEEKGSKSPNWVLKQIDTLKLSPINIIYKFCIGFFS